MSESFLSQLRRNPATQELLKAAAGYAGARISKGFNPIGAGAVGEVADTVGKGKKPGVFTAIKGAIKGFFGKGGGSKRPTNIYEQLLIGVPVEVAYREWQNYSEFPKFMKGPESVSDQDEDGKTKWTAKIFVNRRSWTATVVEEIENYKIRWESEAPKGTVNGTVTFHPLGDNLTAMVYVLEYRPKGFFERIGNLNRVVGRRARLDVKHFGRFVTMQDAETEEETDGDDQGEQADVQSEDTEQADEQAAEEERG